MLYDTQGNFTVGLSWSKIVVLFYPPPLSLDEHLERPKPQLATQAAIWPQGGVCAQRWAGEGDFPLEHQQNTEHNPHVPILGNRKVAVIWVLTAFEVFTQGMSVSWSLPKTESSSLFPFASTPKGKKKWNYSTGITFQHGKRIFLHYSTNLKFRIQFIMNSTIPWSLISLTPGLL